MLRTSRLWLRSFVAADLDRLRATWELAVDDGSGVVGRCGLGLQDSGRQGMVWYLLDPAVHGRGYATEAARALLAFAFDTLGVHRVFADIDPRNSASARVCERLGMRREAWFVENVEVRGEWCDTWINGLLRREWLTAPTGVDR